MDRYINELINQSEYTKILEKLEKLIDMKNEE